MGPSSDPMARVSRRSARGAVALLLASSIYVAAGGSVDDGSLAGGGRVPRGVDPARAAAYQGDTFACEGGAKVLDARKINDEYCDCADGTDEPGEWWWWCTAVNRANGRILRRARSRPLEKAFDLVALRGSR